MTEEKSDIRIGSENKIEKPDGVAPVVSRAS